VGRLLSEDGVHFTPEGYEVLGKAVADVIRKFAIQLTAAAEWQRQWG
jgi:lysophospholipase L1-like esterase